MSFKERVGNKSLLLAETVALEKVYEFCDAVGAPRSLVAPPTFMTILRRGEFELFSQLGVNLSQILHAEQEFQYLGDIRVNQSLEYQTELTQALEKKMSDVAMHFLTFSTQVWDQDSQELLGVSKTKIVAKVPLVANKTEGDA